MPYFSLYLRFRFEVIVSFEQVELAQRPSCCCGYGSKTFEPI